MSTVPPTPDSPEDPPTVPPTVVAIHLAKARRLPTRAVEEAYAASGHGFTGDRYEDARHRHLTVQSLSDLRAAGAAWGSTIEPGSTRRNVTLSHGAVPTRPGTRLRLGELEVEVVRVAAPCRIMEDTVGPGAHEALRRRGGSVVRVLTGGALRLGDRVELVEPADAC
ncbi:MOSC domain-containing protein [Nocardioides marmoraquaticus]